ncbi:helix-turn-helix transcriptional regulator [Streptosporangium sp. NPDC051022]|uniref:helix-turn-helix domain-containing protein n=1 Tax=Streptosporangium sp. NPDC051022 TaxID=3155752 RepID=UPI00343C5BCF
MTTGQDLRSLRESQGVSLVTLSREIRISKGHLSRVERGERPVTPALVLAYRRILGVSVAATSGNENAPFSAGTVDSVKRRELLSSIAAASVGAAALEPLARLLDGLPGSSPSSVGLSEVKAVESATQLYMDMDLAGHSATATAMARGVLSWSVSLLDRKMSSTTRERLFPAVGLLADRLGWATYDSGASERAIQLLTFALDSSAQGADRDLRAHVMLDLSTVVTDMGRPSDGVEILRMALGDERISSAEQANLHAVAARHCATAGQHEAGLRHIVRAEEALSRNSKAIAPDWARRITVSAGHHDSALGIALFALGEDERARERLTAAVRKLDTGRTRTGLRCLTRLAVLDIRAGAYDQGEVKALQAAAKATDIQSTRVSADLRMVIDTARRHGMPDLAAELTTVLRKDQGTDPEAVTSPAGESLPDDRRTQAPRL